MNGQNPTHLADEQLLALALDRENPAAGAQAASALLQRYHGRVFQWCHAQLGDADLAEDVAQEVLIKAYRSLGTFAGRSRFSSWLFTIVRHRCLDELRRRRPATDPDAVDDLVDPSGSVLGDLVARSERDEWLEVLRCHLVPLEQEAMHLRYYENMAVDEITRVLGLAEASGARGLLCRRRGASCAPP